MKIIDLIEATGAEVLAGNIDSEEEVVISTDTRTIKKGDFYLPLKGASFDGEKFIAQALEKGAIGAFCTGDCKEKNAVIVKVRDNSVSDICLSRDRHPISDSYVVWSLSRVLLLKSHGLYPSRLLSPWDLSRQRNWSGFPFPSPSDSI